MGYDEFKQMTWQDNSVKQLDQTDTKIYNLLKDFDFSVAVIVNTASDCGFTRQYKELQQLYTEFKDRGLIVIAQPSNNFDQQEPGSDSEIKQFCETQYGVSFPLLPKADVIEETATELYKALTDITGQCPKWNFHKYVISKKLNKIYSKNHFTEIDEQFVKDIETLLN
jgi:glutathione peroxidase